MLSSSGRSEATFTTISAPVLGLFATKPPVVFAVASAFAAAARSSGAPPCAAGVVRPVKTFARLTTAAAAGLASGTLMISIFIRLEFSFCAGLAFTQPGSSVDERIGAEPDT